MSCDMTSGTSRWLLPEDGIATEIAALGARPVALTRTERRLAAALILACGGGLCGCYIAGRWHHVQKQSHIHDDIEAKRVSHRRAGSREAVCDLGLRLWSVAGPWTLAEAVS
jgi:hypothetical protein